MVERGKSQDRSHACSCIRIAPPTDSPRRDSASRAARGRLPRRSHSGQFSVARPTSVRPSHRLGPGKTVDEIALRLVHFERP
ncbi:hypothetical protein BSF38_10029 (plasmid) [Paludisphaera borealis]|uniref:Uncharacterized protein n=1 Tax=Paludisphaera borealis TaxID=1387353 RepID=A0A1U7CZC2_9BACT|nr:hypothetical protein BSF38_10029 [Paludisphaera borealis]